MMTTLFSLNQKELEAHQSLQGATEYVRSRVLRGDLALAVKGGYLALAGSPAAHYVKSDRVVSSPGTPAPATAVRGKSATEPRWDVEDIEGNNLRLTPDEIRAYVRAGKLHGGCLVRRPDAPRNDWRALELLRDVRELQEPLSVRSTSPAPTLAPDRASPAASRRGTGSIVAQRSREAAERELNGGEPARTLRDFLCSAPRGRAARAPTAAPGRASLVVARSMAIARDEAEKFVDEHDEPPSAA